MPHLTTPAAQAARLRLATVMVEGLSAVGREIVGHLVRLNVGTVLLKDPRPVNGQETDLSSALSGLPLAAAVQVQQRRSTSITHLLDAPGQTAEHGVDLTVMVVEQEDPVHLRTSTAILPVLAGPHQLTVGPVLNRPGGPCAQCIDLQGLRSSGTEHPAPPDSADSAGLRWSPLWPAAAGIAAQQVHVLLRGGHAAALESACVVNAGSGLVHHQKCDPDPECECLTQQLK